MNRQEMITMLKKENILEDIENGPTSVVLSDGKKNLPMQIKQVDDSIEVTTGKVFKQRIRISIRDMER